MIKLLIITLFFIAGCASKPSSTTPSVETELPKATPPPGGGVKMYEGAAPTAIEASPSQATSKKSPGRSCDTPLGTIPDGGKATGYLKAVVPADEVCISDTITCKNGEWSGQAIHPTCKEQKTK